MRCSENFLELCSFGGVGFLVADTGKAEENYGNFHWVYKYD